MSAFQHKFNSSDFLSNVTIETSNREINSDYLYKSILPVEKALDKQENPNNSYSNLILRSLS